MILFEFFQKNEKKKKNISILYFIFEYIKICFINTISLLDINKDIIPNINYREAEFTFLKISNTILLLLYIIINYCGFS